MKWLDEVADFKTKTFISPGVIYLNWLSKIELRGPIGLWASILLLITIARVYFVREKF